MRVVVCGARDWTDRETIRRELARLPVRKRTMPTQDGYEENVYSPVVVHGGNGERDEAGKAVRGADLIAAEIALGMGLPVVEVPARWQEFGRAAGPVRNQQMIDMRPCLVIAFHPDLSKSRGTRDTVRRALKAGIRTLVVPGPCPHSEA